MKEKHVNRELFDVTYNVNTQKARKEMSKSVFVASSPSDIKVFNYCSAYEIADQASLIKCARSDISHEEAMEEATQSLTGLSSQEYSKKIDELFLEKKESHKEMKIIWENFNFPTPHLDFSDLPNYGSIDIASYQPKSMLERGTDYIRNASLFNLRNKEYEDVFFSRESINTFLHNIHKSTKSDDTSLFLRYINSFLVNNQKSKIQTTDLREVCSKVAKAIGFSDVELEEFFILSEQIINQTATQEKNFAKKMLYSYWAFQREVKKHQLRYENSTVLYHGKYAKDFINLYEHNFFQHTEEHDTNLKHGIALWAELNSEGSALSNEKGITHSSLNVVVAKSYTDGSTETVATLHFDYIVCSFREEKSKEVHLSQNKNILNALSDEIYSVLSQQFYPLYGVSISKGEGLPELLKQLTIDEGERGGILNLRDINISSKYSDRIIPELIKGVYDLIDFDGHASFPLFSCMVGGDIIINDDLFPVIKSPLLTVISAKYLSKRISQLQKDESNQNTNYADFFSEYKGNAHHYYNRMTFDPLRPILVY